MSEKYYTLMVVLKDLEQLSKVQNTAFSLNSTGVEEFSLNEPEVDEILGERSYSGADIPESVINEVVEKASAEGRVNFYFATLSDCKKFETYLNQLGIEKGEIKEFLEQDWNAKWRESYKAIKISDDLEVVPSWEPSNEKSLKIYPGMGFGTGSHETTFLCLKAFSDNVSNLKLENCLDFGCGSGILGLATYKYNTDTEVDFYDIDQAALDNTVQNLELNNFQNYKYRLLKPENRNLLNAKYNIVFANILKNVLELEAPYLTQSCDEDGLLILSGLLKGQEQDIISLYSKLNPKLSLVTVEKKNDWVCIVFRNTKL